MKLAVRNDTVQPFDCTAVIVVPEQALIEAGHICCLSENQTGQSKHEFHALGQMALIQYEDGELSAQQVDGPLCVTAKDETVDMNNGIVVCRLRSGALTILSNADRPVRKYLETANRFCTRWVRLDI